MDNSHRVKKPNQVTIVHTGELVFSDSHRRESNNNMSDNSSEGEKIELKWPKPPEQQESQQAPSREGQPSPEKKPSTISVVNKNKSNQNNNNTDEDEDEDDENNNDSKSDTSDREERAALGEQQQPSNRSFRLDWPSEQYDQRRDWFRECLDCINQFRFNCGMFVNNGHVQFFIIVLICINAIMMGIGTFAFVKENERTNHIFDLVDLTFLIIFTVELCFQFIYHGWRLILDGWLVFDLIIIVTSWSFSSVQIIRAFRIFRALRLVTRIKIMKNLILGKLTLDIEMIF
jgi:hypothetical protein